MCVDNRGRIIGQMKSDGVEIDESLFNTLADGADAVQSIKRRTGTILAEAGLTRWLRER